MDWKTKAAAFRILDRMPMGRQAHYLLQRHVTREWPRPAKRIDGLVAVARRTLEGFRAHSAADPADSTFLEIGSGRDLAVPLALRLSGAGRVVTLDLHRQGRLELVNHAAREIARRLERPAPRFDSWPEVAAFGIDYRAPQDARRLPGDLQIDCFFSNEVLEHIPEPVLEEIFEALKGNLRPGGLALHRIDYTDHFARSDATASRFNFLTYSDPEWAPYNTSFQYVNRLRHSDFERLFARAGWTIRHQERRAHEPDPAILGRLADRFRTYTPEDLFVASGYFVLQPETAG